MKADLIETIGLINHLVYDGLLDPNDAKDCHSKAKELNISFISYLVKNQILTSETILNSCYKTFGISVFDLTNFDINLIANIAISNEIIWRHRVITLYKQDGILYLGISDPTDRSGIDAITFHLGMRAQILIVAEDKLDNILQQYFNPNAHNNLELTLVNKISLDENSYSIQETSVNYDEPLIKFVDNIIQHAIYESASDIHIEPFESECRIRYRQNGLLREVAKIPSSLAARLVARLKIMAKLNISERRLPQDGRFQLYQHDIRINSCPTLFGEKIALRILNANNFIFDMNQLGFLETQLNIFINKISQPQGMIVVTGPTGSGKTITLYTALDYLNMNEKNISTVEDPVEIQLYGINQININSKIGLNFSNVLRTLLRQDPDIIMIGEIRDIETAEIAIQAAQTGHLVFSTLHTNSAIDAITRLRSMGAASYDIASTCSLIIAQRLIRKLCEHCKQPDPIAKEALETSGKKSNCHTIFRAIGCPHCLYGYNGRIAIYELLNISEYVSQLILTQQPSPIILEQAKNEGFISLHHAGLEKVINGETSLLEIHRVLKQ